MREGRIRIQEAEALVQKERQRVEDRIQKESDLISRIVTAVTTKTISSDPHWYERGNILALDMSYYREGVLRPPGDAERFVKYIKPLIKSSRQRHNARYDEFLIKKSIRLQEILSESDDPNAEYECVRFSLYLLLGVIPDEDMAMYGSRGLRASIESMKDYIIQRVRSSVEGLPESQCQHCNIIPSFLQLQKAYMNHECFDDQRVDSDSYHRTRPNCFHKRHIFLFDALLKQAHKEARANAHLAVSGRLPVELADAVADFMPSAEGLPAWTTVVRELPEGEGNKYARRFCPHRKELHMYYTCPHMQSLPGTDECPPGCTTNHRS